LFTYDALGIEPQDFYKKEHQIIFDAMKKLWVSRRTIDVLTIGDELVKM
jgi:replicative DNA helicase